MQRSLLALILFLALGCTSATAQWHVGPEIGGVRFWGATRPLDAGSPRILPWRHTSLGLQATLGGAGLRARVALRKAEMSLAAEGVGIEEGGGAVLLHDALSTLAVRPSVSFPFVVLSPTVRLRGDAGILLESWSLTGESERRTRVGPAAGLILDVDVNRRVRLTMSGEIAVTGSPFEDFDLPEEVVRSAAWRRGVYGGVTMKL